MAHSKLMESGRLVQMEFEFVRGRDATHEQVAEIVGGYSRSLKDIGDVPTPDLLKFLGFRESVDGAESVRDMLAVLEKTATRAPVARVIAEIARRYHEKRLKIRQKYTCSQDVFGHMRGRLEHRKQELFVLIFLDNKDQYLGDMELSRGTLNRSLVHPREVFATAMEWRCAGIICVHNHPSGDATPSQADIQVTRRLTEVGKLVGIPIVDHVVIGLGEYCSMADHCLL